ncbi:MFS general substrate transporter [Trichoderma sp. SZMC 28014]
MDSNEVTVEKNEVEIKYVADGFEATDPIQTLYKKKLQNGLLLKVDIVLIGMISLIMLVNQWDRGNIGNARLMGLQSDLHISNGQFYNILSLYYVGYMLFIIPAYLTVRSFKANRQIGGCVILFATFSCCTAAAKNAATVLALRVLIGAATAFLQSLSLYTSLWYKRDEMATRSGLFYSASTIAGGFSGLIAYAIQQNLDGALGYAAWQWLFIIQGCVGIFVGICSWILLPNPPDQVQGKKHWLFSQEEIELAVERLKTYNTVGAGFDWVQVLVAFKDPKLYLFSLINIGISLSLSSISSFLPTFINDFNYSPVQTQLFSIIPYACAFVTLLVLNTASDRLNVKAPFSMLCHVICIVGYIILMLVTNDKVKMFGACLITTGVFPAFTIVGAWTGINIGGFTKRAITWAVTQVVGQCFSIVASHIYTDPPRYLKGHSICLAFQVVALLSTCVLWFWMRRLNKKKDEEAEHHRTAGTIDPRACLSLEEAYDYHPNFRYIL